METNKMSLIVESITTVNKMKIRKLHLKKAPPNDTKDNFYLNKYRKRNTLNPSDKGMCLVF